MMTLRDKIAANLYLSHEQADQGTPTWDELIATYGDDYEGVKGYRLMADMLMPVVDKEILRRVEQREAARMALADCRAEAKSLRKALARAESLADDWEELAETVETLKIPAAKDDVDTLRRASDDLRHAIARGGEA